MSLQIFKVDSYLRNENNPLEKSNLRYMGFLNDFGEALKSFLPKPIYYGSYILTGLYAVSAVYYTNRREYDKMNNENLLSQDEINKKLKTMTINSSIWHMLATVSITPLIIITTKKITGKLLTNFRASNFTKKMVPSTVGLIAIPIVVPPVDNGVTCGMNYFTNDKKPYHWSGLYNFMNNKH